MNLWMKTEYFMHSVQTDTLMTMTTGHILKTRGWMLLFDGNVKFWKVNMYSILMD